MQFLLEPFDHRTKFLALFLVWTLFLGLTTLSVQHSCHPLIGAPSSECTQPKSAGGSTAKKEQPKAESNPQSSSRKNFSSETKSIQGRIGDSSSPSKRNTPSKCNKKFIPIVAGAGSGVAAGAGASALAGAGVISTTITVGGAVVAAPATVAVATGILVFLVVRSLTGAC